MAREFQNMRDRNIVNSWENGGKFEGKKVTDQMLLSFWKGRRGEVARGDPLWDQYDQTVTQYEFAISNSKMELGYAQGKKTPAQMAAFYRGAAGKLPENSEAWRKMMQLAAQYKDRAISAGRGRGRARSDGQYNSASQGIYNKNGRRTTPSSTRSTRWPIRRASSTPRRKTLLTCG